MVKKFLITLLVLWVYLFSLSLRAQNNILYKNGEYFKFNIYYSIIGIYFNAGTANFELFHEDFKNQPVYHVIATGSSNTKYDWIFKVRDKYETFISIKDFKPLYFKRNVSEGKYKVKENIDFNYQNLIATTNKGEYAIPDGVQDVLSAIYFTRFLNYNN